MDYSAFFEQVKDALAPVLMLFVLWLLKQATVWLNAKIATLQADHAEAATAQAVAAAEQVFEPGQNDAKYKYVENVLEDKGIEPDRAEIEAAVHWMKRTRGGE